MIELIGIAGTNGAGKDTVGGILVRKWDFRFISVTDLLRDELNHRGLELSRENMRQLSSEWRRQYGLGVLVNKAEEIYKQDATQYKGLALASLRNPGEVDEVHAKGGVVIWLDADPRLRYDRIQDNAHLRGKSREVDDKKTFEVFLAEEEAEMYHSDLEDKTTLSLNAVKKKSDIFIFNNTHDLGKLTNDLAHALSFSD